MDDDAYIRAQVKDEIRRRRRALRRGFPADARETRSHAIAGRVRALPEWGAAQTVLAFVSMRTEVQTGALIESAWETGKRVAAPCMNATFDDLVLREWARGAELEESGQRFLQPLRGAASVADEEVDLVIVPALAVDPRGHRVGYGKGYYDRLLPRLVRAFRVAVIFDFERIAEVPTREGDVPVHAVVTDERTLHVAEGV